MHVPSKQSKSGEAGVLLVSRLVIIGAGYATYVVVARAFPTAEFGVYGIMSAIINVLNTVVGTGTNQAISRLVSRNPEAAAWISRRGLGWAAIATLSLAVTVALGARYFALLLRDASLAPLFVIAAAVPGLYAFIAVYSGLLNGRARLARQGLVNMSLALARLVLIPAAALLSYGVAGTLYGSALAALVAVLVARWLARGPDGGHRLDISPLVFARMMVSFVGVSLLLQLLLANDVLLIKRLMPVASADQQAGIYTAAQSIARIPYYLLIGISQVVYPRLSARRTGDNVNSAQQTSSLVLSAMVVLLAGILAVCLPLTASLIRVVYPARYAEGGQVLGWLLGSSAALSLAEASLTMLSGATGPKKPAAILAVAVVVQVGLGLWWVPRQGPSGAAIATLFAALFAGASATLLLRRLVGSTLRVRLLGSTVVPAITLLIASSLWARLTWHPVATLAFMAASYGGYLVVVYRLNAAELKEILQT